MNMAVPGALRGIVKEGTMPSAKPYAVMEFDGLLATAFSSQSLETLDDYLGGSQPSLPYRSAPPLLSQAPPTLPPKAPNVPHSAPYPQQVKQVWSPVDQRAFPVASCGVHNVSKAFHNFSEESVTSSHRSPPPTLSSPPISKIPTSSTISTSLLQTSFPDSHRSLNHQPVRVLGPSHTNEQKKKIRSGSPHDIPKSQSESEILRRAYLDVTQTQPPFQNKTHQLTSQTRHLSESWQSKHPQMNKLHMPSGHSYPNIQSPTSPNSAGFHLPVNHFPIRFTSPLLTTNSDQPFSDGRPDILPRHFNLNHHHQNFRPNISSKSNHGQIMAGDQNHVSRRGSDHRVIETDNEPHHHPVISTNNVFSYTPPSSTNGSNLNSSNESNPFVHLPFRSPRSSTDEPSALFAASPDITATGSSSPGSLYSSPPTQNSYQKRINSFVNGDPNGNKGYVINRETDANQDHAMAPYCAQSPFTTGSVSGNTSTTLSDAPLPNWDLVQKPGPNLIKPIAFRPSHGVSPARTPVTLAQETIDSSKGTVHSQPQLSPQDSGLRSSGTKLGAAALPGLSKGSPVDSVGIANGSVRTGAFRQTDKPIEGSPNNEPHFNHANQTAIAQNPSSPEAAPLHSSTQNVQNTSDNGGVYKNIVPDSTYPQHNRQGAPDVNTSYSSFNGEFPLTESTNNQQSTQPSSSTNNAPQTNQQQRGVETSMLQTPSPSDSGVGEHEAVLREKDAEINTLREVMDRNERAIFQVHEERRHVWLNDTRKLQDDYERKLKVQSRKSYKTEQVLSLQVYKLQQEQRALQEEKAKVAAERDSLNQRLTDSQTEVSSLRAKLGLSPEQGTSTTGSIVSSTVTAESSNGRQSPSQAPAGDDVTDSNPTEVENNDKDNDNMSTLQRELLLKNKELIQLHSRLAGLEADLGKANRELTDKAREIVSGNDKIRSLQEELHRVKNPPQLVETGCQTHAVASQVDTTESLVKPSLLGERDRTIEELQEEMLALRTQLEEVKTQHEEERSQWLDEKNKVVRYQKQLQLNYVQMQRKNCTLETEVQQLTLELENRELKLVALNGEESVC